MAARDRPPADRLRAAIGVAIVHMAIGYALLAGLATRVQPQTDAVLTLIDLRPPPPPPPVHPKAPTAKARARAGAASPRNLKAKPAEIKVPPPAIPIPRPPPLFAAPKAGTGAAPSAGASALPGPGFGSGGIGDGSGSGGAGDGPGAGGDGDGDGGPEQIKGRMSYSDVPAHLIAAGVGGTVGVRYRVGIDGRASACLVTATSGNAELDALTCRLIEQRFRFLPARDEAGRPFAATIVERHEWVVDDSLLRQQRAGDARRRERRE